MARPSKISAAAADKVVAVSRYEAPFANGSTRITPSLASEILSQALARGADFAELYGEYRRARAFSLEDGRVRSVSGGIDVGVGIRVVHGTAVGFAYCENLDPVDLKRAADNASRIAKSGSGKVGRLKTPVIPSFYPVHAEAVDGDGKELIALLRRAEGACRKTSPKIVRVDANLVAVHKEILVASSDGVYVLDIQPMLRMSVSAVARHEGRSETGSSSGGGRRGFDYFDDITPEDHGKEAARVALLNLDSQDAPAGTLPVVLAPGDSGILLHEAVGHGLEADFNRKRTSNYTDKIGEMVASKLVTVVDDPTIAGSRGSLNVDDEGVGVQSHRLIVDGKLVAYLHDKISSQHFKVSPTGSGRRESFRHVPLPRMSNTFLQPGEDDPEDIIRSVKKGIYAKKFTGGQVNISNGDFVFSLTEGYLIEDGKITAPLKGVNLIGNGPTALSQVSMVGHDFALSDGMWTCGKDGQSVPVGVGMPTVKLDALTVGGTVV